MGAPTLNCHFGGVVITVNSLELIGAVGARILAEELDKSLSNAQAGIARYLLDRLQKDQTIAIVHAVINDKELSSKVFVAIPANVAEGTDLPARVVTGERNATYFRNREPPNGEQALLVVNIDDIQNVSLGDMTRIGSKMLTDRMDLWVDIAAKDLVLPETSKEVWKAALKGLTDAHVFTVGQLAKYISATRARIQEEGQPLQSTLGYCLPILRVPRDSTLAIAEQQQRHRSAWKKKFEQMVHERAPLLGMKLLPSTGASSKRSSMRHKLGILRLRRWPSSSGRPTGSTDSSRGSRPKRSLWRRRRSTSIWIRMMAS
jgi:S-DNA-T family DNA segregation ATPase FtsK/SpoIIIE